MSDFEIDIHALDVECVRQPDLCRKYGRVLAEAQKQLKELQARFEAYKAKTADKIRDKPQRYGSGKTTVSGIQDSLKSDPKYKEWMEAIAEAEHDVALAWADVHAINHKKDMLSDLVRLHGQQYFSDVKLTEEGVSEVNKTKARQKGIRRSKNDD